MFFKKLLIKAATKTLVRAIYISGKVVFIAGWVVAETIYGGIYVATAVHASIRDIKDQI